MCQVAGIVASVVRTNLDYHSNQVVTLYSVPADGIFRVSFYAGSPTFPSPFAGFTLTWTDEQGTYNNNDIGTSNNPGYGIGVVRALASTDISLTINSLSINPTNYNFYATVEQLQ